MYSIKTRELSTVFSLFEGFKWPHVVCKYSQTYIFKRRCAHTHKHADKQRKGKETLRDFVPHLRLR